MLLSLPSCLSSIAASSTILYNSGSLLALSLQLLVKYSTVLSRLTPTHPSRQRSLSICLEVSNSSTYRVSFVQPPHQLTAANVVWFWNTTLSLAISIALVFFTDDTAFLLAEELEEIDTRCIVSE